MTDVTLDLEAISAEFLVQCGACDAGLPMNCACTMRDHRPTMLALVEAVEILRAQVDIEARDAARGSRLTLAAETREQAALKRAEVAEARVDQLTDELALTRDTLTHRTRALNETGASNDTLRAKIAAVRKIADEWKRSGFDMEADQIFAALGPVS